MTNRTVPHQDEDAVLTLYTHYFLAAELMLKNYKRLLARWQARGRLTQGEGEQYRVYFGTWLGFLAVTAEGFKGLSMRKLLQEQRTSEFSNLLPTCNEVGAMLRQHDDALRKFRNKVFHLRDTPKDLLDFIRHPNRIDWAEELQAQLRQFFSEYRIEHKLHTILQEDQVARSVH
jgi:hypothetical protein